MKCLIELCFDGTRAFDVGAWDVGAMVFKGRQLTQMANYEIKIDMEVLQARAATDRSLEDKAKLERLLSAKEMIPFPDGLGSIV